jgi:hypothetical protein
MSDDEGEKFFMEYWNFGAMGDGGALHQHALMVTTTTETEAPSSSPLPPTLHASGCDDLPMRHQNSTTAAAMATATIGVAQTKAAATTAVAAAVEDANAWSAGANASMPEAAHIPAYRPALLLHTHEHDQHSQQQQEEEKEDKEEEEAAMTVGLAHPRRRRRSQHSRRSVLAKRAFECPAGTRDCAGIGRPTSCCAQGETCQLVPDTGLGDVGCCAAGKTCAGAVRNCEAGYAACAASIGGGCCIPNYECVAMGCKFSLSPSSPFV